MKLSFTIYTQGENSQWNGTFYNMFQILKPTISKKLIKEKT